MNLEFFALFAIFLFGFAIIYIVTDKIVDWLFGSNDKEKQ